MFRYKSNKQAFIIAAMIILVCLICLTGATYALFTSDINDGTIGVITTSGDVRVDIVDSSNEQSLVGQVLEFITSSDNEEILFEPGATFYTQGFKVKNTGEIPINYRLSVSEDEDIDMQEFNEAFDIWITTDPKNMSNAERLTAFVGSLNPGQSTDETYYLCLKMKETAGNYFQDKTYTGIGITVFAVQGNAEIGE